MSNMKLKDNAEAFWSRSLRYHCLYDEFVLKGNLFEELGYMDRFKKAWAIILSSMRDAGPMNWHVRQSH